MTHGSDFMFEDISKVLLITDMDGTFLPASKIPTPKTLAAVKRFEEAGGRFSIATGRAIQAARQYFDMVNVNCPIIMSNGGMVYDIHTKEQIYNVFCQALRRISSRRYLPIILMLAVKCLLSTRSMCQA